MCRRFGSDTLWLYNSSTVSLKYAYLITDEHNRLQSLIENPKKDLWLLMGGSGSSRIYGVSYGGGTFSIPQMTILLKSDLPPGVMICQIIMWLSINRIPGNQCKKYRYEWKKNSAFIAMFPNPAVNDVTIQLKIQVFKVRVRNWIESLEPHSKKLFLDNQMIDSEQIRLSWNLNLAFYFLYKNEYIW